MSYDCAQAGGSKLQRTWFLPGRSVVGPHDPEAEGSQSLEWSTDKVNKLGLTKGRKVKDERAYSLVKLSRNQCIKCWS